MGEEEDQQNSLSKLPDAQMGINNWKISKLSISRVLFLISCITPFFGMLVSPTIVWPVTFSLVTAWILLGKHETYGALAMMWGVQVEPAPCDTLFIYAWFKRLVSRKLAWPSFVGLHMLLFFILLNVLQLFWVQDLKRGLWFTGATAYTISLSFFLASGIRTMDEFQVVRRYYLAAVIVTAGTLLLLAGLHLVGLDSHLSQLYIGNRPMGFFKDPNVAGPFVVTGALFALSQLVFRREKIVGMYGLLFFVLIASVIITFSRGALLNFLVGIIMLGAMALKCRRGMRFVAIAILMVLIIVPFIPMALETFGQASRLHELTPYDVYGRFAAWQAGLLIFRDIPWGIGPGQFEIISPAYERALFSEQLILTPSSHNTYLRVLAENGLLGFIILFMGLLAIFWNSMQAALLSIERNSMADATWVYCCLGGFLAESFVIDTLHWRHIWIIAGLALAYRKLQLRHFGEG